MPESIASLDSVSISSQDSYDSDEEDRIAEQEWKESLEQLQQLFSIVLLPYLGKWLGRKWSYWAYARYVRLGLGMSFFLDEKGLTPTSA
ncbi:hypothetical protein AcW1_000830 [Taiwanofungus camphoratus]|nr:hypothetical protein AcW2_000668 [Antrodia cinnamomea]KAI0936646.1 hypothetical protein AcV5_004731 [Antrodia cinnamomea]KAI0961864.1 hypothetical protein AcV7_000849 [Antrodia cinnamomea]KAI0963873.1 hypothetical protein AcW1_000830 [Antrodia cinnamomea]